MSKKAQLQGFTYDAKRQRVVLEGDVAGVRPRLRKQRTIDNVTHAEAVEAWTTFRAELQSGHFVESPNKDRAVARPRTLRQFIGRDYDLIASNFAPGTKKTQLVIIKSHLLRYFGDDVLSSITAVRVTDFMADMRGRGNAASYINDAVRVLKMLLHQAVEREVIAAFPIKKRVTKLPETRLRLELDRDERARFFATFSDEAAFRGRLKTKRKKGPERASPHFSDARRFGGGMLHDSDAAGLYFSRFHELRDYFIVAVETGLRVYSDLRNLQWSSVDLGSGFIRVEMQKTHREAEIPISRVCAEALRRCKGRGVTSMYVFVDPTGKRFSPTRIRRTFVLAKELADITRRFRLHDLRHTFGCRLADGNISLPKIAKALGHTSTRMAERYVSPATESMREITRALDDDALLPTEHAAPRPGSCGQLG